MLPLNSSSMDLAEGHAHTHMLCLQWGSNRGCECISRYSPSVKCWPGVCEIDDSRAAPHSDTHAVTHTHRQRDVTHSLRSGVIHKHISISYTHTDIPLYFCLCMCMCQKHFLWLLDVHTHRHTDTPRTHTKPYIYPSCPVTVGRGLLSSTGGPSILRQSTNACCLLMDAGLPPGTIRLTGTQTDTHTQTHISTLTKSHKQTLYFHAPKDN